MNTTDRAGVVCVYVSRAETCGTLRETRLSFHPVKKGRMMERVWRGRATFRDLQATKSDDSAHLNQFILHSAMDMVDEAAETSPNMYLKIVDRFNDQNVFAFATAPRFGSPLDFDQVVVDWSRTSTNERSNHARGLVAFRDILDRPNRRLETRPRCECQKREPILSFRVADHGRQHALPAAARRPQRGRRAQLLRRGLRALRVTQRLTTVAT